MITRALALPPEKGTGRVSRLFTVHISRPAKQHPRSTWQHVLILFVHFARFCILLILHCVAADLQPDYFLAQSRTLECIQELKYFTEYYLKYRCKSKRESSRTGIGVCFVHFQTHHKSSKTVGVINFLLRLFTLHLTLFCDAVSRGIQDAGEKIIADCGGNLRLERPQCCAKCT